MRGEGSYVRFCRKLRNWERWELNEWIFSANTFVPDAVGETKKETPEPPSGFQGAV